MLAVLAPGLHLVALRMDFTGMLQTRDGLPAPPCPCTVPQCLPGVLCLRLACPSCPHTLPTCPLRPKPCALCPLLRLAVRSVRAYVGSYLAGRLAEARRELQAYADRYRACMHEALEVAHSGAWFRRWFRV